MKKPKIAPKLFAITSGTQVEISKAVAHLQKWQQSIDVRLFREGYILRDGVLHERQDSTPISVDDYWKRKKHGR